MLVRRFDAAAVRAPRYHSSTVSRANLRQQIASLLRDAEPVHQAELASSNGIDPEWPLWYANHLVERFRPLLGEDLTRCQLVSCLMAADAEHHAMGQGKPWPEFYAAHLIDRLGPAEQEPGDRLALYQFDTCPFCRRVRAAIERLGVNIELRDIHDEPRYRQELIAARGRATVPVLRVTTPDGHDRWMPESRDIVRYLERTYGD